MSISVGSWLATARRLAGMLGASPSHIDGGSSWPNPTASMSIRGEVPMMASGPLRVSAFAAAAAAPAVEPAT